MHKGRTCRHEAEFQCWACAGFDPKPGNTPGIVFGLAEGGIETVVASLAAAGVEIVTPVSEAPGGWSAEFRDPDGHRMAFWADEVQLLDGFPQLIAYMERMYARPKAPKRIAELRASMQD